jgi:multidrug efflux pump subunit AcrA (membrane-fusion protein)
VVHMIVPTADRSKATVLVKVRFVNKDSRILPEMSAKVAFLERPVKKEEQQPRMAINPAAIVSGNDRKTVFVIKGNRVVETEIKTGAKIGDLVEVLGGVKAGDKLALKPLNKLKDGRRIKTAEK